MDTYGQTQLLNIDSIFNEKSASQDTPCDDSYTPCASWPPQAFFGHSAEGSISCGGLQSIFNGGELACEIITFYTPK